MVVEPMKTEQCVANPDSINYVGNTQRGEILLNYGSSYNPSWKNYPNFSCNGNQNNHQVQGVNQYCSQGAGPHYYNPNKGYNPNAPKGRINNEELIQRLMTEIGTKLNAEKIRRMKTSKPSRCSK